MGQPLPTIARISKQWAIKAVALLTFAASNAAYAGLLGDEVQARWIYAPFFDQTSTFLVGPGIELVGTWGVDSNLDVGDNYIEATIVQSSGITFGPEWHFSSLDFGRIGGFSVSTNFSGWNDSWLTFTSDSIDITFFSQVQFPFGEGYLRITLLPASTPVSEPASGAVLFGLLVILLVVARTSAFRRPNLQRLLLEG
jgi:hypothetical protein